MCRWCEWVAAAALHAVTTRSIGAGCLSTGGKRVGGTCRLRTRSSPLLDIHHAHVRVDVCRTSAEVLPEGGSSQWRGHGHHTITCIRIPTSVPHHTSDYLHYTTPHYTSPLPYHNKHPATATNTATTTTITAITAIINQAADRCLPSAP